LIAKVVKACKAYAPGTLWSITSDGNSCRGAALAELTLKHPLSPTSRIHPLLSPLPNFNLLVGDNDVMCDKDYKHLYKQLRTLLLQAGGFRIFNTTITPQVLEQHLQENSMDLTTLRGLMNPSDKQDVPKAFELLKCVLDLLLAPNNRTPTWRAQRHAIYLLGHVCYLITRPFTDIVFSL